MPTLSIFFGIIVHMWYHYNPPSQIHANRGRGNYEESHLSTNSRYSFCGCATIAFGQAKLKDVDVAKAKSLITEELKDPESARFRRLYISNALNVRGEPVSSLCGEINAKNSMGGYSGFKRFYVIGEIAMIDPGASETNSMDCVRQQMFDDLYIRYCAERTKALK